MEELFLMTENGNIPIDKDTILKYNLKRGAKSPFSSYLIADKNGNWAPEPDDKHETLMFDEHPQILTTSEILDFMQGSDSDDA